MIGGCISCASMFDKPASKKVPIHQVAKRRLERIKKLENKTMKLEKRIAVLEAQLKLAEENEDEIEEFDLESKDIENAK